jgi:hypothetical protein
MREGEHMSAAGRNRRGRNRPLTRLLATTGGALLAAGVLASPAGAVTTTFSNPTPITIPAGAPGTTIGPGDPYPSSIEVSGLQGNVVRLGVTLHDFSHTFPEDVGVVLVAPGSEALALQNIVGSGTDATNLTFNFEDGAPPLPDSGALTSGTYKPTAYGTPSFTPPGPTAQQYRDPGGTTVGATLAGTFGGASPNGTWNLFVEDLDDIDTGSYAGGWSLHLTTPNTPETTITQSPKDKTRKGRATFGFTASAAPVRHTVTFQCKLDKGAFEPCTSPTTYRVKKGKHTFQVLATVDGVTDSTPATDTWKRKKPKKK